MLTAQQIHDKNFAKRGKGYDMDDVDAFLDEVIDSFDKLSRESKELSARIEALNTQIESYRGMENTMMHTMVTVHKAAEEITESAKREADETYNKARQQADDMVERATQESEHMIRKAHEDSQDIIDSYKDEIHQAEQDLLALNTLLDEFKAGIHHYTDELLGLVDRMNAPQEVQDMVAQAEEEEDVQPEPRVDYVGQYVAGINKRNDDESNYGPVEADEEEYDVE